MTLRNTPVTRVVCSTVVLVAILYMTASKFDRTEWMAVAAWAAVWGLAEMALSAEGHRRKGIMRMAIAPFVALAILACNAARPLVSEVSVTYTGTMKSLGALAEVVRWQR